VTRFYAEGTPISTFGVQKYGGGNRPELAKLMGARLVIVNEIKGEALESSVMKAWTGGDMVSATPKYGHPLGFYADGTIVMVGNELPEIDFEDDAMWSRVAVVRFPLEIPDRERDRGLPGRFEQRGVLAWMVQGHAEYGRIGLRAPRAARLEKKRYRQASDPLSEFWEDCVVETGVGHYGPDSPRLGRDELYGEYTLWAKQAGIPPRDQVSREAFVKRVNKRAEVSGAFCWKKSGAWRGWVGVRLARGEGTG
jgi:putative DNA primase/helicase